VKQIHSPSNTWQILSELDVRAGSEAERLIEYWLTEALKPLGLHTDLIKRISRSAREAAARTLALTEGSAASGHIHLLVFGPQDHALKGQTCGFFRLEKLEHPTSELGPPGHSIEFYLYGEDPVVPDRGAP
jgi:hypothetical protein